MSEEATKRRGRQKGETKDVGYVHINSKLRVRVEVDNLVIEESTGQDAWGKQKYFGSWEGVFSWLVRRYTTDKVSAKKLLTMKEARKEILDAIKELKYALLGGIESQLKSGSKEIQELIKKY